ncbi:hypothetical protein ElyMa_000550300 [Elysia marginata]|uniref:Uncharacterized protein n=1 Tax=Elysia marginata TaxID=1093978 RepID=A0AAV4G136_9GAST|nr:hypothetical protein ElyMa_000550300 [Elysia marginata]
MCVNSLSQGLNVDLPKAGFEPWTSRSESQASTTRPRRHGDGFSHQLFSILIGYIFLRRYQRPSKSMEVPHYRRMVYTNFFFKSKAFLIIAGATWLLRVWIFPASSRYLHEGTCATYRSPLAARGNTCSNLHSIDRPEVIAGL